MDESTAKPAPQNTWNRQVEGSGEFVRKDAAFRSWIRADGSSDFAPETDRYHLYVSLACPWAHRTLIARRLKGLEKVVSVNVVDPLLPDRGWTFEKSSPGTTGDTINGFETLRQAYEMAVPGFEGIVTVPVLWDKRRRTIVNNESSEIIRMLNGEFQQLATRPELDLYPESLRASIDGFNAWIYPGINNGVYRAGFAQTQSAYSKAVREVFAALDRAESVLADTRYLCGDALTEADVRLFVTLLRFDPVYVTHFKCNIRRIVDYPNLWGYTRDIYQLPGVSETVNMEHIKRHYFESHRHMNPYGIVPEGPELDLDAPHGRG
jgi:putative glutathione S-transferase